MTRTFCYILVCICCASQSIAQEMTDLTRIRENVSSKRVSSYDRSGDNHDNLRRIAPGEKRTIFDVKGAGIIQHIWITMGPEPDKLSRNDVIISMYWDGNDFPSVQSPIGPFFGQGWNDSYLFTSAPLAATPANGMGLVCYFAMPFSNGARIEIENQSASEISTLYFYIDYAEMKQLPPNTGRFHAWYNRELTAAEDSVENEHWMFGPGKPNKTGERNYVIADIKGKGHFAGVNYYVHSPTPYWYGEGDDMIFIDGGALPALHGTGTEDYFNTSWGAPQAPYSTPYFGYPEVTGKGSWQTHITVSYPGPRLFRQVVPLHYRAWQHECADARPGERCLLVSIRRIPDSRHSGCGGPQAAAADWAGRRSPLAERVAQKQRKRSRVMGELIIKVNHASGTINQTNEQVFRKKGKVNPILKIRMQISGKPLRRSSGMWKRTATLQCGNTRHPSTTGRPPRSG